jgi:hypothetical protein
MLLGMKSGGNSAVCYVTSSGSQRTWLPSRVASNLYENKSCFSALYYPDDFRIRRHEPTNHWQIALRCNDEQGAGVLAQEVSQFPARLIVEVTDVAAVQRKWD